MARGSSGGGVCGMQRGMGRRVERGSRWILFSPFQLLLLVLFADAFLMIFMGFIFRDLGVLHLRVSVSRSHDCPSTSLWRRVSTLSSATTLGSTAVMTYKQIRLFTDWPLSPKVIERGTCAVAARISHDQ